LRPGGSRVGSQVGAGGGGGRVRQEADGGDAQIRSVTINYKFIARKCKT